MISPSPKTMVLIVAKERGSWGCESNKRGASIFGRGRETSILASGGAEDVL